MIIFVNEEGSVIMPENRLYYLTASLDKCARRHEEGKLPPPLSGVSFCCKSQFCRVQARQIGPWMQSVWHVGDAVSHRLSCFVVFDWRRAAEPVKMTVSLYAWRGYGERQHIPCVRKGGFRLVRRYPAAAGWGRFEPTVLNLIIKNNTNLNVYAYE